MNRFFRAVGWVLVSFGVCFALLSVVVALDPKEKGTDATLGMIMFAIFGLVPGALILWRTRPDGAGVTDGPARVHTTRKCEACGASLGPIGSSTACPYCGSAAA